MGQITKTLFGQTAGGEDVHVFKLEGAGGAYTEVLDYGAIWKTSLIPGKDGRLVDVCLSYDTVKGYEDDANYIGAIIGRFANRIKAAAFTLDGVLYNLQKNDGEHSLHGGTDGYNKRIWSHEINDSSLKLRLRSPDGDQGYPGNLDITVTYAFDGNNVLTIDYLAVSDKDTPINMTNHAYFNLAGAASGKSGAMAHTLRIDADAITEMDEEYIETGRFLPVDGAPYDFRTDFAVGARLDADDPLMRIACGYDFNFVVNGEGLREAAVLACPQSGISLRLAITNPGLQFYSSNMIQSPFELHGSLCLEPQHYPNSVNVPQFPSCILKAGERYAQRAVYRFERS
ncbi:MAG: galactose mutarotase [Clostridiales bacterium]|nr:galactose mutarotase [Clostridiales bacterium]